MKEKIKKICEIIGEALADGILQICSSEGMQKIKEDFGFKQENKEFEREYFYLMMFLSILACKIVFTEDRQLTEEVLAAFHKYIMKKRFNLLPESLQAQAVEIQLQNRYQQYQELLKTKRSNFDLDFFLQQVQYDFLANVLEKDLNYIFNNKECIQRYGKATILFGFYIREVFMRLTDSLREVKEKYINLN